MQAPMSSKFRRYVSDPRNASKLTELIIQHEKSSGPIKMNIEGKEVTLRQLGIKPK